MAKSTDIRIVDISTDQELIKYRSPIKFGGRVVVDAVIYNVHLDVATRVDVVETVRAADGLALSSRNRYLDADERRAALALSRALEAAAASGDRGIDAVLAAAQSVLMGEELVRLDYLKVVDPRTFQPVDDDYRGPARVLIAAKVGDTRLIDNDSLYLN